jgi:aryl-alcohol dehydrogenase-like predicted oxidoreductase
VDRRTFILRTSLLTAIGAFVRPALAEQNQSSSGKSEEDDPSTLPSVTDYGEMLYRLLGSTGERVSAIGLGGSHIAEPTVAETESIRLVHEAIDRGITFMDNSWDYNQGQSELRMGKALAEGGYRDKVFLMTKIDGRTKDSAMRQIETSLERLKTDHVDLLQHHEILRFDDPDRIFGEDGAMEAFLEAKKSGKSVSSGLPDIKIHECIFTC